MLLEFSGAEIFDRVERVSLLTKRQAGEYFYREERPSFIIWRSQIMNAPRTFANTVKLAVFLYQLKNQTREEEILCWIYVCWEPEG